MSEISIIGLDLAKLVFQVHGAAEARPARYRESLRKTIPTTHTLALPGEDFKQVQNPCLLHEFNRVARVAMYNRMILQAFNLALL